MMKHFNLDYIDFFPVNSQKACCEEKFVEALVDNDFAKFTAIQGEVKNSVREEMMKRLVSAMKEFRPDVIFSAYLCLVDCMNVGIALQIPVLFLGMQVMICSNYLSAFGMFPRLPTTFSLNRRLWNFLCEKICRDFNATSEPFLKQIFNTENAVEDFQPTMEEFFDICSCDARYPVILCASLTLHGPVPPDFNENIHAIGALSMDSSEQVGPYFGGTLTQEMEAFLKAGDAPVYIGYGSMTCYNGKFMTLLSLRGLMKTGQRGILLGGWAEMSAAVLEGEEDSEELLAYCKDKVLFMDTAPHGPLFPRCKVIVHHGGAGTLNTSAMSGIPTVIVPIFLDQFYHSDLVNAKGFGVGLKAMKEVTPDELADAINQCIISADIKQKAAEVAAQMSKENQARTELVEIVDRFLVDYVDTGRFLEERSALRKQVFENTWKHWMSTWFNRCACFTEARKSEIQGA
eukprot:symbB.v1.2.007035.t1/scaffold428.1/size206322/10